MKYYGRVKRHASMQKDVLEGRINGRRGRGRPRKRWKQDICDPLNMSITEIERLAQDRNAFRRVIMTATSKTG